MKENFLFNIDRFQTMFSFNARNLRICVGSWPNHLFKVAPPILSRLKSILAILPKCPDPILGGFSPNRGSNNGSPPPPSLNHKGVTGVHHEGTRDTSGEGGRVLWFLRLNWNFKQTTSAAEEKGGEVENIYEEVIVILELPLLQCCQEL